MTGFPSSWPFPERVTLEGKYCRLEPIQLSHGDRLYELMTVSNAEDRYLYIPGFPPKSRQEHDEWLSKEINHPDFVTFVVINKATNQVEGRHSLMRIVPEHGVVEIGYVMYSKAMSRTKISTEAFYLTACYVFEVLKYRRFEWKCDNENVPSKNAALRYGFTFEALFRQHLIVKGKNRDTAWFSMLDHEWPALKGSFVQWLDPTNFDDSGMQVKKLNDFRV